MSRRELRNIWTPAVSACVCDGGREGGREKQREKGGGKRERYKEEKREGEKGL